MEPLTPTERKEFQNLFDQRLEKVKAKTRKVFEFEELNSPPFLMNAALYHLFGHDVSFIPDNYFDDPAVMTQFQERIYFDQITQIDDDFVPYLMPWFGTVVAASAFGCKVEFHEKQDPAANPRFYPIDKPDDIKNLKLPNVQEAGLMSKVLAFQKYMKENSFLPVGITDLQGPLTTANQLMGYDKLIYLMADHPDLTHKLMEIITETLIQWVKMQKSVIGEPLTECFGDQQVYTGENIGVWLSDDDAVLMSPSIYREFVVPHNSRILKTFGGGVVHYCGNGTHQAENFLATEGLRALNVYALADVDKLAELQEKIQDKIVLFACDFTPVDYQWYFKELISKLNSRGLVIDSQFSPVVGLLEGGKYHAIQRDLQSGRKEAFVALSTLLG